MVGVVGSVDSVLAAGSVASVSVAGSVGLVGLVNSVLAVGSVTSVSIAGSVGLVSTTGSVDSVSVASSVGSVSVAGSVGSVSVGDPVVASDGCVWGSVVSMVTGAGGSSVALELESGSSVSDSLPSELPGFSPSIGVTSVRGGVIVGLSEVEEPGSVERRETDISL